MVGEPRKNKMPRGLKDGGWSERWKLLRSKSKLNEEWELCMYGTYNYLVKKQINHL